MAFEQVNLRMPDGQIYGPVAMTEMLQWHVEGRVPPDGVLIDAVTGEERPVRAFAALTVPPPPMALPGAAAAGAPSGMDRMIPVKNTQALIAYYCGIFGLIPCVAPFLGIVALVLGILGLRKVEETGVGRGHAIAGIVLGGLELLITAGLVAFGIVSTP